MASFRFLSSLFALIAVIAFAADVTPALNGTGPFRAHSVIGYWTELAPASLIDARNTIDTYTFPWVWNPVLLSILGLPMSVLFTILAVICGYFGRRRERLHIHIN